MQELVLSNGDDAVLDDLRERATRHGRTLVEEANASSRAVVQWYCVQTETPGERVRAAGYIPINWGENIAAGYSTAAEAVAGWMSSEGHRDNLLNPGFTEIGLGIVADERGNLFYTQVFGTPWRP